MASVCPASRRRDRTFEGGFAWVHSWHSFEKMASSFSDAVFLSLIDDDRYQYLLRGLGNSLKLTAIAAVVGVILGLLLAVAKLQDVDNLTGNRFVVGLRRMLAGFANGYISVVRGTRRWFSFWCCISLCSAGSSKTSRCLNIFPIW